MIAKFSEAFIVFFNLSEKGDTNSQFNLSNMYSSGIGTTQDYKEALKCGINTHFRNKLQK